MSVSGMHESTFEESRSTFRLSGNIARTSTRCGIHDSVLPGGVPFIASCAHAASRFESERESSFFFLPHNSQCTDEETDASNDTTTTTMTTHYITSDGIFMRSVGREWEVDVEEGCGISLSDTERAVVRAGNRARWSLFCRTGAFH